MTICTIKPVNRKMKYRIVCGYIFSIKPFEFHPSLQYRICQHPAGIKSVPSQQVGTDGRSLRFIGFPYISGNF